MLVLSGAGAINNLLYSTDAGDTWNTAANNPFSDNAEVNSVMYGNSVYIAYSETDQEYAISYNGINWINKGSLSADIGGQEQYHSAYGNKIHLLNRRNRVYKTNDNGQTWSYVTLKNNDGTDLITINGVKFIRYINGIFILGGVDILYTSTDGENWSQNLRYSKMSSFGGSYNFGHSIVYVNDLNGNKYLIPFYRTAGFESGYLYTADLQLNSFSLFTDNLPGGRSGQINYKPTGTKTLVYGNNAYTQDVLDYKFWSYTNRTGDQLSISFNNRSIYSNIYNKFITVGKTSLSSPPYIDDAFYGESIDGINWTGTNISTHVIFLDITDNYEPPIVIPPGTPGVALTDAVRNIENNNALISYDVSVPNPTFFENAVLQYRLIDLNSDWNNFETISPINGTRVHNNKDGYFSNGTMQYRIILTYNNEEYISNIRSISSEDLIARYVSGTITGFEMQRLRFDESNYKLTLNFKAPKPVPSALSIPNYLLYQIKDIATGRLAYSTLDVGGYTNLGATGKVNDTKYYDGDVYPIVAEKSITADIANIVWNEETNRKEFRTSSIGQKGLKIDWSWYFGQTPPEKFIKSTNNYGGLYFYPNVPNAIPLPPPSEEETTEPRDPKQKLPIPIPDPDDPDDDNIKICIDDPDGSGEQICIIVDDENQTVCIVETKDGVSLQICNPLPAGAEPGDILYVRRDNDYITIVFNGEVVVTYLINPVKFPNLSNSKGWIRYYDRTTNLPTTPINLIPEFPDSTTNLYKLKAVYQDRPLANKRPFIYGYRNQAETVYIDRDGIVRIEEDVLAQELVDARVKYENGLEFIVDTATAYAIWQAGGYNYITAYTEGEE